MATEIDYTKFPEAFQATFRAIISPLEAVAIEHDDLMAALSVKPGEVSDEALENARLRNKTADKSVTKLNEQIEIVLAKLEELKAKAYDLVQDDIPQPVTDEEKPKIQARIKDLREVFKLKSQAVKTVAESVAVSLEGIDLPTITANGRSSGTGTRVGHSGPRIRMEAVYVNGEYVEAKKPNNPDEMTSNFTVAAAFISAKVGTKVTATELQTAYFDKAGTQNVADIPVDLDFSYIHHGADGDKEFAIKAKRQLPGQTEVATPENATAA